MNEFIKIICKIDKKESGKRLDQALTNLVDNLSRSQIKNYLLNGNIKKGNIEFKNISYKVKLGEKYEIKIPLVNKINEHLSENIPLNIIYEDEELIVVNKKAGMVTHPAPGNKNKTLVNALLYHTKNKLSNLENIFRPGIVHRLDKETSGLLVIAKNDFVHNHLSNQFKVHSIKKNYKALVWGIPSKKIITGYIGRNKIHRKKMSLIDEKKGKFSETVIKIKKTYNICSLIDCKLKTGRTHQIRVHLDSIGNPIVGDKVYGIKKINYFRKNKENHNKFLVLKNFKRHALHAYLLGFYHPSKKEFLEFKCDLPADFSNLLKYLSKY